MKYLLSVFGILVFSNGFGQDLKKYSLQFDFGTALTYQRNTEQCPCTFIGHPQTDYSTGFGYFVEILISRNISKRMAIATGVNYNVASLKINDKIGISESKGSLNNSYLTIPLFLKYGLSNKFPINASIGPYFGLLLNANEKGITNYSYASLGNGDPLFNLSSAEYDSDIRKDYTSTDLGLSVQLDYELALSKNLRGIIITRFNYGLKNVLTNELNNKTSATEWQNRNVLIGFGIKL